MLNRLEKYKNLQPIKKVVIIVGALFISISLGTGVKASLTDHNIQSLMTSWFSNKKQESIIEIDNAITLEKANLMRQLKEQLQIEMQTAKANLEQFTANEKAKRLETLEAYAASLKAEMKIDNSEQEVAISANLDAIIAQAKAQMDGQAAELKLLPVPTPEIVQEPTPSPEAEEIQEQNPDAEVIPPTPSTGNEGETPTSPVDNPIIGQPVVVDIYSVTDWFVSPNVQNVELEDLTISGDTFSINSTFSDILMNPKAREAMNSILRGIENHPQFHQIQFKTIDEMSRVAPSLFNEKVLFLLNKSLSTITI